MHSLSEFRRLLVSSILLIQIYTLHANLHQQKPRSLHPLLQIIDALHSLRDSHAVGSVEEWMQWRESVKVGMRKPLGLDFNKRRYWALGGRSACWRVYVEEADGGSWGWYEGG